MSRIRTNVITNRMANGAPTVSNGLVISGLTTTSDVNVGTGATLNVYGGATYSGVVTATSFSGSGANLTSLPSQVTINNASGNRVITSDGGTTLNCEDTLRYDGTNFLIGTNTEAPYSNRNLTVAAGGSGSTTVAIEIRSPSNGTGRVIFSDGTSADSSANEGQVIYQQSDHKMLFGVAANYQNMALESTGGTGADLNLIDGNLKFASGHGIDFSATSDASGMASELFDDYEEGTFTPTLDAPNQSGTTFVHFHNHGYYTKIGNVVTVAVYIQGYASGNASGGSNDDVKIINLPFAPAILEEEVHEYFEMPVRKSPYMQFVAKCKHPEDFPAIVHADGTSRVQTVSEKDNPGFYNLLKTWKDKTGCPMLLNTSLNIKGKPMVNNRFHADKFEKEYNVKVV